MKDKLVMILVDLVISLICIYVVYIILDAPLTEPLTTGYMISSLLFSFGALYFAGRVIARIVFWRWY